VRRLIALSLLASCVAVGACRGSPSSKAVPAPKGLPPFYAVPSGVAGKSPGTLLKSQVLAAPTVQGTVHRVMYVSRDARGRSVPVTGLVFVPETEPPPDGYPVVSWAHGTNGMADQCAPSLEPDDALRGVINPMLALGWEVVATDYQGEGTPPVLPYLVGDVAARNSIDIILAARHLPSSHASSDYIVWGHSEGGQSALFAWQLATYGARSGLEMVGAIAAAPPSQLEALWQSVMPTQYRVYLYMMLAGFNAGYGDTAAPLGTVLTPKGTAVLPTLEKACLGPVTSAVDALPFGELVSSNPFDVPTWRRLFAKNDPANFPSASSVPLLIVHGGADEVVPVSTSALLTNQLCSKGANVERWVYPGQSHGGVLFVSAVDVGRWMINRFQGSVSHYQPTGGTAAVQLSTCPGRGTS